jgi:hypothetical protein
MTARPIQYPSVHLCEFNFLAICVRHGVQFLPKWRIGFRSLVPKHRYGGPIIFPFI